MADVLSLPVSTSLLAEVNAVGDPGRNKEQDGTIGDKAHEERASDHNRDETGNTGSSSDSDKVNEVHARDVDSRGPWKIKGGAERIVQLIVADVRRRSYAKRRVKYVIYRGRIWVWRQVSGAWTFVQEVYTGADQHTEHFHVSFMYGSGAGKDNPENDTSPWGILTAYQQEDDVTKEEMRAELTTFFARGTQSDGTITSRVGRDALDQGVPNPIRGGKTSAWALLEDIAAQLKTLAGQDDTDESAIAAGVLAGLTTEKLAAAITASGLTPAALAAAIPEDLAVDVVDEINARLDRTP